MAKQTSVVKQTIPILRKYYSTKMSQLTLAMGMEPEDYLWDRIKQKWSLAKIFLELRAIAKKYQLPMMTERGLRLWVDKINKKKH